MTAPPTFATCTYQEFDPSYGIPVKSTVGHPRFKLRYDLADNWQEAAPDRAWFSTATKDMFRERYSAKLDATGPDGFHDLAQRVRSKVGDRDAEHPIVLLCFDKLWMPDTWCHRTMFGEWWEEQTGEVVPEFGKTRHADRKPIAVPAGLW
jgi:hypothetical protein